MVSATYSAHRSALAKANGLGRKEPAPVAAKRGRRKSAEQPQQEEPPPPAQESANPIHPDDETFS